MEDYVGGALDGFESWRGKLADATEGIPIVGDVNRRIYEETVQLNSQYELSTGEASLGTVQSPGGYSALRDAFVGEGADQMRDWSQSTEGYSEFEDSYEPKFRRTVENAADNLKSGLGLGVGSLAGLGVVLLIVWVVVSSLPAILANSVSQ